MDPYEMAPNLEINLKKSCLNCSKKLNIAKKYLFPSDFTYSKIKAYSFFKTIEEKERKNRELTNNNTNKINDNDNTKDLGYLLKLSIENYKNKKNISIEINESKRKNNSIKVKQFLEEIRRKTPKNIKHYKNNNFSPICLTDKKKIKEQNTIFRNLFLKENLKLNLFLISQKQKYKISKRNIENGIFNINNNTIIPYSNQKININEENDNKLYKNENYYYFNQDPKKISTTCDNKINQINSNNYLDIKKKLNRNKNNEDRLLTIERNILNSNYSKNRKFSLGFKKKQQLIRMKKSNRFKKFILNEIFNDKNYNL